MRAVMEAVRGSPYSTAAAMATSSAARWPQHTDPVKPVRYVASPLARRWIIDSIDLLPGVHAATLPCVRRLHANSAPRRCGAAISGSGRLHAQTGASARPASHR